MAIHDKVLKKNPNTSVFAGCTVSFPEWLQRVEAILDDRTMLDIEAFPDNPYFDWWAEGITPRQAADAVMDDAAASITWE